LLSFLTAKHYLLGREQQKYIMADSQEKTVTVTAELPESMLATLVDLANKRRVSANTVLQQAIQAEKFFSESIQHGGKILIEDASGRIDRVIIKDLDHQKGDRRG
jgi:hypothetical protein